MNEKKEQPMTGWVRYVTLDECLARARSATRHIHDVLISEGRQHAVVKVYGVPRGGIPAAALVAKEVGGVELTNNLYSADFIVDDLIDSGATRKRYVERMRDAGRNFTDAHFVALFDKSKDKDSDWLVMPWEGSATESARDIPTRLLQFIGESVGREGLRETPARFLKAWQEYTAGYKTDVPALLKTFEDGAEGVDELVIVRDIPVYSHCEHHLAPFFGVAHVGYIPNGRVLGLSKMARVVDAFARRLQVQERLTQQVARALSEALEPRGVGVIVECRHMCMEARGVQARGAVTTTSCLLGVLKDDASARAEFMRLASGTSRSV